MHPFQFRSCVRSSGCAPAIDSRVFHNTAVCLLHDAALPQRLPDCLAIFLRQSEQAQSIVQRRLFMICRMSAHADLHFLHCFTLPEHAPLCDCAFTVLSRFQPAILRIKGLLDAPRHSVAKKAKGFPMAHTTKQATSQFVTPFSQVRPACRGNACSIRQDWGYGAAVSVPIAVDAVTKSRLW